MIHWIFYITMFIAQLITTTKEFKAETIEKDFMWNINLDDEKLDVIPNFEDDCIL